MEGRWVFHILDQICIQEQIDESQKNEILKNLDILMMVVDGLGFCMSEIGDSLAQWRGYANNGAGFCIGLDKQKLIELSNQWRSASGGHGFKVDQIVYDLNNQISLLKPAFTTLQT
ncbi:MAG: DUF2971 domain-containing protein, partial [Pseudomonadota bacterium]